MEEAVMNIDNCKVHFNTDDDGNIICDYEGNVNATLWERFGQHGAKAFAIKATIGEKRKEGTELTITHISPDPGIVLPLKLLYF